MVTVPPARAQGSIGRHRSSILHMQASDDSEGRMLHCYRSSLYFRRYNQRGVLTDGGGLMNGFYVTFVTLYRDQHTSSDHLLTTSVTMNLRLNMSRGTMTSDVPLLDVFDFDLVARSSLLLHAMS